MQIVEMFQEFVEDEEGATMIEYALLAGLISVVAIAALTAIGTDVKAIYEKISAALKPVAAAAPAAP